MIGLRFLCLIFQAARLLHCYANPADKIRVLRILEPVRKTFLLILYMKAFHHMPLPFWVNFSKKLNFEKLRSSVLFCFLTAIVSDDM